MFSSVRRLPSSCFDVSSGDQTKLNIKMKYTTQQSEGLVFFWQLYVELLPLLIYIAILHQWMLPSQDWWIEHDNWPELSITYCISMVEKHGANTCKIAGFTNRIMGFVWIYLIKGQGQEPPRLWGQKRSRKSFISLGETSHSVSRPNKGQGPQLRLRQDRAIRHYYH